MTVENIFENYTTSDDNVYLIYVMVYFLLDQKFMKKQL